MGLLAWLRFESPAYLSLVAILPLLIVFSQRSLAGLGRWRRWLAIVARMLVLGTLILALAGALRTQTVRDLCVVFLVDRSRSVPQELQREAFRFVRQAAETCGPDDRLGVIAFDGAATIEQLPMRALEIDGLTAPVDPHQTSLAAALRLALALLPPSVAGRVVMLSDGNENLGDVLQEAQRYSAAGIPIDVVPLTYEHVNEVVLEQLRAPATANAGETVTLQVVLRAQRPCTGKLLLWHNNALLDLNGPAPGTARPLELEAGANRHVISVPLPAAGVHQFRAEFVPDAPEADTITDNNLGQSFTVVAGQPRILILTTAQDAQADQSSAEILRDALAGEKLVCDLEIAGTQPLDQVRLLEYSLVILNNVPASDLREEEKQTLATYVRELGGGLVMIGGDEAFGAGGWMGSPVEEVMPVSFDVKHRREIIRSALVLVMHACEIPEGNYLGERSAIEAVKALSSRDLVGVLAWKWQGTEQGYWVVPLQEVGSRTAVINAIKRMDMGDMPDLDAVMRPGVEALIRRRDAGPKHMIVISDFDPQEPRQDLINAMKKHGITCTTIAIGYGGHPIMEDKAIYMAESTGGRFYRTNDHSKLPQIFVRETRMVQRALVQEGPFNPQLVDPLSPLVPGLAGEGLPELRGLVLTTRKEAAIVPLTRKTEEGEDPVLAHWQAGLGKTVAFTSGLWPRWGPSWTAWPKFNKFWGQIARWAARQPEAAAFDVITSVQGGRARLQIEALDKNADVINFMDIAGTLITPGQQSQRLVLTQTGPGRYEAEFDARERGNYVVSLAYAMGKGPDAVRGTLRTGVAVTYSPEYARLRANVPLLEALRTRTDGRVLGANDAAAVWDRAALRKAETRHVMWETLVRWALVLFLLDVAIRRIAVDPREAYRRLRQFIAELGGRGRPAEAAQAVLTTLKDARQRVREEQKAAAPPPPRAPLTPDARATRDLEAALGGAKAMDKPVVAPPSKPRPATTEADYTSRLLRAKRRAQEELRKDATDEDKTDQPPPAS